MRYEDIYFSALSTVSVIAIVPRSSFSGCIFVVSKLKWEHKHIWTVVLSNMGHGLRFFLIFNSGMLILLDKKNQFFWILFASKLLVLRSFGVFNLQVLAGTSDHKKSFQFYVDWSIIVKCGWLSEVFTQQCVFVWGEGVRERETEREIERNRERELEI